MSDIDPNILVLNERIEELEAHCKRLRLEAAHANDTADAAIERAKELEAENQRLGQQCEGLMQAGMNNGQALILAEAKLAAERKRNAKVAEGFGCCHVPQEIAAAIREGGE